MEDVNTNSAGAPDLTQGPVLLDGKYELVRMVGEGGMGSVYEARNRSTGRRVAVKRMASIVARDSVAVQRFIREARVATSVEHPNVVQIFDVGAEQGVPYIVMELLDGESLAEYLERTGAISPRLLYSILAPILDALSAAHSMGIVHRDVKPENIFLARVRGMDHPVPKLLDFGISRVASTTELGLTSTGTVLGTPYYMAPEQAMGRSDVDSRADVYAMGVICHYALAGEFPFAATNYNALLMAIVTTLPPRLDALNPSIPSSLADVVARAMGREVAERIQTTKELSTALRRIILGSESAPIPMVEATLVSSEFVASAEMPAANPVKTPAEARQQQHDAGRPSFAYGQTTPLAPESSIRARQSGASAAPDAGSLAPVATGSAPQVGLPTLAYVVIVALVLAVGILGTLVFVGLHRDPPATQPIATTQPVTPQAAALPGIAPAPVPAAATPVVAPAPTAPAALAPPPPSAPPPTASVTPRATRPARVDAPMTRTSTAPVVQAATPPAATAMQARSGGLNVDQF